VAAAYSQRFGSKEPIIAYSKTGCKVSHTELIGDVAGLSTATFNQAYAIPLNPGLNQFTPWLSNIAQNYESYRCKKLNFRYVTKTGSTTAGSVMMIPDYNASDAAPISEQVAANYSDVQEDVPWTQEGITCALRPQAMHKVGPQKYVRTGAVPANADIKIYDVGVFYLYTVNSSAAAGWGKLWVDYEFDFETPQLPPAGQAFQNSVSITGGGVFNAGGGNCDVCGTTPTKIGGLNVTITESAPGGNKFVISNAIVGAEYMYVSQVTGTVITAIEALTTIQGCTQITKTGNFNAAGNSSTTIFTFTPTATTCNFTAAAQGTTTTGGNQTISLIPTFIPAF
jgi:hypothetical protein